MLFIGSRLLTGIMFAAGGTAVVYSRLGQISGGHINPAVTEVLLRQLARRVKAANERVAGKT